VRPNAATAARGSVDAAFEARDIDAFVALFADDFQMIDHPTGSTYDRVGLDASWRRTLARTPDFVRRAHEIATLGDALCLAREWVGGSASAGGSFDVGEWEQESIMLGEVDARGRWRYVERFAADRLGDAVVRLYERYAELLPEGPERSRLAATARAIASTVGPLAFDRFVSAVAPAVEYVDHRKLIGVGAIHGAEGFRAAFRALFDAADDITNRVEDVLVLRPDALMVRMTNLGRERVGGGPYERPLLAIQMFGADGLTTRVEAFDADCDAKALARFDALTADRPPAPARRVRSNAATAHAARLDAAVEAGDADAISALLGDDVQHVHHLTHATFERPGAVPLLHSLSRA
jgi:ketosteroid isomerase-like protein